MECPPFVTPTSRRLLARAQGPAGRRLSENSLPRSHGVHGEKPLLNTQSNSCFLRKDCCVRKGEREMDEDMGIKFGFDGAAPASGQPPKADLLKFVFRKTILRILYSATFMYCFPKNKLQKMLKALAACRISTISLILIHLLFLTRAWLRLTF